MSASLISSKIEQIGDCTLYLGDCREILPTLGKIDAVITDPPYGIGFKPKTRSTKANDTHRSARPHHTNFEPMVGDDSPFNPAKILVGRKNILWGANNYAEHLCSNPGWLVWYKTGNITGFAMSECELAYTNFLSSTRFFDHMWHGFKRATESGQSVLHPTQKPVALMEWCIRFTTGVVCDPFMGSGTTGVACVKLGRKFIGIEIEPKYFDIACRRIEDAMSRPDMFIEQQKREATTEQLFAETDHAHRHFVRVRGDARTGASTDRREDGKADAIRSSEMGALPSLSSQEESQASNPSERDSTRAETGTAGGVRGGL